MSAPNLDTLLNGLDKVRKVGAGWKACCPAHDDHTPSLSIQESCRGHILVKCRSGCSQDEVINALRGMGLWGSSQGSTPTCPARRTHSTTETEDADDSRRMRQAARLYQSARPITDFPELINYLLDRGINPEMATRAGARGATLGRADMDDKTPQGWIKGEMANGIVWPIYHPDDIFKPGDKRIIGVQREWPWGRGGGPRSVKATYGKAFAPHKAGSGGFLVGDITNASTIHIVEGQLTGLAVHTATDAPVLVLFTAGGLANIGSQTIRDIEALGARAVIAGDADPSRAGEKAAKKCATAIQLTAPQIPVAISIPDGEKIDWLDVLVTDGPEATAALLIAARERAPVPAAPHLSGSNIIPHMPWRRRAGAPERPVLPSLQDMQSELRAQLPDAIKAAMSGKPVLIMVPPGGGKSRMTLETLINTRVPTGEGKTRPINFLWATATKDLAAEAFEIAGSSPRDMVWDGRGVEGLCNRPVATKCLMDRGRSPHSNACIKCEFGVKPEGDREDTRCLFQRNLVEAPFRRAIFGPHGIVGHESTLLKWAADPRDDFQNRDLLVLDEGVPTFTQGEVRIDDITAARMSALSIEDHISFLKSRNTKQKRGKKKDWDTRDEERFSADDFQKARDWASAITPHLDSLGGHLLQSAALGEGLRALDPQVWAEFAKIATKIPPAARAADASALEKVQDVFGDKRVVPLAWIAALGRAVKAGTAWVRVGKNGTVTLVYTNPSDLWTRYLKQGGLLLDASCKHADKIRAAGGMVIDLQCTQPLRVIQCGPKLHGKGDSGASKEGRSRLEQEAKDLLAVIGNDPEVVAVTHKALAAYMKDDRVRHWGTHKGHNDWKGKRRLILWGLPLMNSNDQLIGYKTHRSAMALLGIDLPDWNGERVQEWTEAGEWDIFPGAKLPAVKEARDWLLREVNSDVFQAIGRLRAVWSKEPVTVEVYGFLPITGFGMHIDEMRLESKGRLHNKTRARAVIARGVADLGEARTRSKLQEYFKKHTGRGISKNQCDELVADLKTQAIMSGVTLHEAAFQSCATNTRLLEAGHEPRAIARAAREIGGLPGVVAVADLLDQIKIKHSPGAQRAGP